MISPALILVAAAFAALAVAVTAAASGWPRGPLATASGGAFALVLLWRLLANALSLNEDFMPAVSVGDAVCLLAGGLPPAAVAAAVPALPRRALVVLAGAVAAFAANVVVL